MTKRREPAPIQLDGQHRTFSAVVWALAQSWGGKLVSRFIVAFLARHLAAAKLGIAAAVGAILALNEFLAEQGYGDALVQKHNLASPDLASVFYITLGTSLPVCYAFVVVYAGISLRQLAKRLAPFAISASLMFYFVELARSLAPVASLSAFPRLMVLSLMGGICYALFALIRTLLPPRNRWYVRRETCAPRASTPQTPEQS